MSTHFPGYKHVQSFSTGDDDGEYEYETEECYLTLDLLDVDPALLSSAISYRLIVSIVVFVLFTLPLAFASFRIHSSILNTEHRVLRNRVEIGT